MPSRLGAGANNHKHKRKEPFRLNRPHVHLREEESEHKLQHTSTTEDDLLTFLGMPDHARIWIRFDNRAKTFRTTSSSEPLMENVVG